MISLYVSGKFFRPQSPPSFFEAMGTGLLSVATAHFFNLQSLQYTLFISVLQPLHLSSSGGLPRISANLSTLFSIFAIRVLQAPQYKPQYESYRKPIPQLPPQKNHFSF